MKRLASLFILLFATRGFSAYQTDNFTVSASTPALSKEIGDAAEYWRVKMAQLWLGETMPTWGQRCPITAKVERGMGNGGATSFVFDGGQVFGWRMNIQGSRERIIDSVLPHEISHTVFASHFRQPLPRWADEGACTTVEHPSEIANHEAALIVFLRTGRALPFSQLFAMTEYPRDVMPLYAEGHSVSCWLIEQYGHRHFIAFLDNGLSDHNWNRAIREVYGYSSPLAMQNAWNDWVRAGRPILKPKQAVAVVPPEKRVAKLVPIQRTAFQCGGNCGSCGGSCGMGGCWGGGNCSPCGGGSCSGGQCWGPSPNRQQPVEIVVPQTYRNPQQTVPPPGAVPVPDSPLTPVQPLNPPLPTPVQPAAPTIDPQALKDQTKQLSEHFEKIEKSLLVIQSTGGCQCDNTKLEAAMLALSKQQEALLVAIANNRPQVTVEPANPIVQPPAPAPVASGAPAYFLKLRPHKEN